MNSGLGAMPGEVLELSRRGPRHPLLSMAGRLVRLLMFWSGVYMWGAVLLDNWR